MPAGFEPLVEVSKLTKHFPLGGFFGRRHGAVRAVDDVSFSIGRGETLGLVGESGCGKSTIGRLMLGLVKPTAGSIRLNGSDITTLSAHEMQSRRRDIQLVFQDPYSSLNPRMTIGALLREPLTIHNNTLRSEANRRVDEILDHVGLPPRFARRLPHELSGGQRQRIGIARALMLRPQIIVCDEAVSALDVSVQAQILNLLRDLKTEFGLSYLFISHDLAVVRYMASRVAVMYLGRIVELAPSTKLFSAPAHPYTQALIDAVPDPAPGTPRKAPIEGDLPDPANVPTGCGFHPRCAFATDLCRSQLPEMRSLSSEHFVSCHRAEELALSAGPRSAASNIVSRDRIARLRARFDLGAVARRGGEPSVSGTQAS